ncbi:hypothetical protein NE398_21325 [Clostridium tertium]|uniref:Uncharacterized protein n=1 Tax=Clostridium tertium TaxID=1559 RepID=A0A9X3XN82_9CLOT|nr:hypothetical protein [Clostridium tertium]MDC4242665.1 hypothetical protein [Clostridium tertium]
MIKALRKENLRLILKDVTIKLLRTFNYNTLKLKDSYSEYMFCLESNEEELERAYIEYYAEDNRIIS